ncbi:MAG: hypothetical protein ACRC1W_09685 [Shewanella sp.]
MNNDWDDIWMNDFTKKELEEIKRCLKYIFNVIGIPYSRSTVELNKKVQSMIENYCQHLLINISEADVYCPKCNNTYGKK